MAFQRAFQELRRMEVGLLYKCQMYVQVAVASWLVRSTPERALRVRALAWDIVLCS